MRLTGCDELAYWSAESPIVERPGDGGVGVNRVAVMLLGRRRRAAWFHATSLDENGSARDCRSLFVARRASFGGSASVRRSTLPRDSAAYASRVRSRYAS